MLRSPGNARRARRNPLPASTSAGPLAACPAHAQHGPGGNPAACFPERREWPDELRGQASCDREIGRASCRERVCQYGENSVVAGSLKKKKTKMKHNNNKK